MAATTITNLNLTRNVWADFPTAAAADAGDGLVITPTGGDQRMLIYCENSDAANAETVTIKGGQGPLAMGDLTLSFAAGAKKVINVESGRYMGSDGKIRLTGSADVKVAVIFLP